MQFDGKAGLVTGGGSGIGRATAIGFAKLGGAVAVADINGENANKVVAEITGASGKAIAIVCDVTRPADIDMMIARTHAEFGRIDLIHNNAFGLPAAQTSTQTASLTADVDDQVWNYMIEVGLTAVFRAMKRVLPIMRAQGSGAIVNTASISGLRADYGIPAYKRDKSDPRGGYRICPLRDTRQLHLSGRDRYATAGAGAGAARLRGQIQGMYPDGPAREA